MKQISKKQLAVIFNLNRSSLYYHLTKPVNDKRLKDKVIAVMENNPTYGHKRIVLKLNWNKKKVLRESIKDYEEV